MPLPLPEYDDLDRIGLAEHIRAGDVSPREAPRRRPSRGSRRGTPG